MDCSINKPDGCGELHQHITLPSGRSVVIKKPGVYALRAVLSALPVVGTETWSNGNAAAALPDDAAGRLRSVDQAVRVICTCSVAPRFTESDPPEEGRTSVDELSLPDFNALGEAIVKFGDLGGAVEQVRPLQPTGTPS